MIWDLTDKPNALACAEILEANGFNVQVTELVIGGAIYSSVCTGDEVEEHLIQIVAEIEEDGGYVEPNELLANAKTLDAKNEAVKRTMDVRNAKRVVDLMQDLEIHSAVGRMSTSPQVVWELLPKVLEIAQRGYLRTAIKQNVPHNQTN